MRHNCQDMGIQVIDTRLARLAASDREESNKSVVELPEHAEASLKHR